MSEKILSTKKNGMAVLLLTLLLYIVATAIVILFGITEAIFLIPFFILALIWICLGWIFWCGLKVLKPQEALVLTLFGNYIGTLKGEGFYWVKPFCSAVKRSYSTRVSLAGKLIGGTWSNALSVS